MYTRTTSILGLPACMLCIWSTLEECLLNNARFGLLILTKKILSSSTRFLRTLFPCPLIPFFAFNQSHPEIWLAQWYWLAVTINWCIGAIEVGRIVCNLSLKYVSFNKSAALASVHSTEVQKQQQIQLQSKLMFPSFAITLLHPNRNKLILHSIKVIKLFREGKHVLVHDKIQKSEGITTCLQVFPSAFRYSPQPTESTRH